MIYRNWKLLKAGINYRKSLKKLKQELLESLNKKQALLLDEIDKRTTDVQDLLYGLIAILVFFCGAVIGYLIHEVTTLLIQFLEKIV